MSLIANLSYDERMVYGKADEVRQVKFLIAQGFQIKEVAPHTDMIDKIDRYIMMDGRWETLQIKGRDTDPSVEEQYKDILVDMYEPYCGLDHEDTRVGRDQVSQYDWFTCRIGTKLYLINGAAQKRVAAAVMVEWSEWDEVSSKIDLYLRKWVETLERDSNNVPRWKKAYSIFRRLNVMRIIEFSGVEVRCTQDRRNNRPKLLIFIPPTLYTADEAKTYEMKEWIESNQ